MSDPISISVVIPTYNLARMLPDCIESVLSQTRPADEIIVVDDGSQDNTAEVVARYGNRVRYIRQLNSGVAVTRNRGIQEARGNWIAFLDADDLWYPPKLERQCAFIEMLGAPALVCSDRFTFTTDDPPPPPDLSAPPPPPRQLTVASILRRNTIPNSGVIAPKSALLAAGGFNKAYNHAEDMALWLQVGTSIPMWVIPQPLIGYRDRVDSLSYRSIYLLRDIEIQIIEDFCSQHRGMVSRSVKAQSIAGAYFRAATHLSAAGRGREALSEAWQSFRYWPLSLPEYRPGGRIFPMARVRLGLSAIRHLKPQPQNQSKRVLMYAYYFPPISSIGTLRTLQFIKYLDQLGWQSVVVTVKQRREVLEPQDNDLISQVPRSTVLERTSFWSLQRITQKRKRTTSASTEPSPVRSNFLMRPRRVIAEFLQFPDRFSGWLPFAIARGILSVWKYDVDLIYSSAPPYSGTLAGLLTKVVTRRVLVSDFRDPWCNTTYIEQQLPLLREFSRKLERFSFRQSEAVIHVSQQLSNEACQRHKGISSTKFLALPNGFDPEEFSHVIGTRPPDGQLRICHIGSFYSGYREPTNFLKALQMLSQQHPDMAKVTTVYFVGEPNWAESTPEAAVLAGSLPNVHFTPRMTHHDALQFLAQSDLLLLIGSVDPESTGRPAKLFEYLAVQKPILALLHEGEFADLCRATGIGIVANPTSPQEIADALVKTYKLIEAGNIGAKVNRELLQQYDRRQLSRRLADLFDELSAPRRAKRQARSTSHSST